MIRLLLGGLAGLAFLLPVSGCQAQEAPLLTAHPAAPAVVPTAAPDAEPAPTAAARLRLVDIGADKCIPCRAMAPILEELRVEHAKRLEVIFVDVWKNPAAGESYGVEIIPTQIFYDRSGREVWRHQGFLSKRGILDNWKRLGFDLEARTPEDEDGKQG